MGPRKKIINYLETNEYEHMTTQNLWDTMKAVLRGKTIALQAYLKKPEQSQINNLAVHLKELEKEQTMPTVSRRKERIKIRAKINDIETKKIQKINEIKSWLFKKVNKIDKLLSRLLKENRKKTQINKIRNERDLTTDPIKI